MSRRTIPPWWANPIVFIPAIVTAVFLLVPAVVMVGAWLLTR